MSERPAWVDELPRLHRAAATGDLADIADVLDAGADIDAVDPESGFTPLGVAAAAVQVQAIAGLLARRAAWEQPDGQGVTALARSSRAPRLDATKHLLEAGADLDALDASGNRPMGYFVADGDLAGVNALLAAGADVNAADANGWTPIAHAAEIGSLEVVQRLLDAGASATGRYDGSSLSELAARQGHPATAELLSEVDGTRGELWQAVFVPRYEGTALADWLRLARDRIAAGAPGDSTVRRTRCR